MFKNFLIFSLISQMLSKASNKFQVKKLNILSNLQTLNVWLLGGMSAMIYFKTPFKILAGVLLVCFLIAVLNNKQKD